MKKVIICLFGIFCLTGCIKTDHMEDINIKTTSYPIEFITNYLYQDYARSIESIFPDNVDINNYELNDNEIKNLSNGDLFIYNGVSKEPKYAIDVLNKNTKIKIIDAAKAMEYSYKVEELWLEPYNFLMLAGNIKSGFGEYIKDPYIIESIQKKYDELDIKMSEYDVEYKAMSEAAVSKTLVVSDNMFNYLTKYGINVISLEESTINAKTIAEVKKLINSGTIEYIFLKNNEKVSNTINKIVESTGVKTETLHTLSNITDKERNIDKLDYFKITEENMEKIKKELYK